MAKCILGVAALLLFIGGGTWWYLHKTATEASVSIPVATSPGEKPWIEVVAATATAVDVKSATTTLYTGDEVDVGYVIKTDSKGVVIVHFPDGSFAKLDPNSSMEIKEVNYDESNGVSNVHVTLSNGTLWSKVLGLVGANSSWQVETSDAVATVRGTSFMTSVSKGKTKVVGIEHKVKVAPIDPETRKPISTEAEVDENVQIVVEDTRIPALISGKEKLITTPVSADVKETSAYKEFKVREQQFDTTLNSIREKVGEGAEFRKEFRESQVKAFQEKIIEMRGKSVEPANPIKVEPAKIPSAETKTNIKIDSINVPAEKTVKVPEQIKPVTQDSGLTSDIHPVSLSVISNSDLSDGITEGDTVIFRAILMSSDNSKKDVTDLVEWNVINKIGIFPSPGKFLAQLSSNDAEIGDVPGAIYATFKYSDGKELNGASKQFNVHAYLPPQTVTEG